MDISTSYLGMKLAHPFVAGASPLGYRLETIKRLEDAGCADPDVLSHCRGGLHVRGCWVIDLLLGKS